MTNCSTCYSLCKRYDELSDKVNEVPENTEELVTLEKFLQTVSIFKTGNESVWET